MKSYNMFSASQTLEKNKQNKYSIWGKAKDRLIPEAWPEYSPTFNIDKNAKIFTIGSCFPRHIEEYLHQYGYNLPMLSFSTPKSDYEYRMNGVLNKYTPPSMFQEIKWCEEVRITGGKVTYEQIRLLLFECRDGNVIDMQLGGFIPVTKENALERRQIIYNNFSEIFSSQVVIITLGFIET